MVVLYLTNYDNDKPVFIMAHNILTFMESTQSTCITFVDGSEIYVKEKPNHILACIPQER